MNTLNKLKKIKIRGIFSDNLAFRQNADDLFDYANLLPERKIIFDFTGITSMSRSFAHQYGIKKKECTKKIIETGKSDDINRMFELVKKHREKKPLIDVENLEVLVI